MTSVLTNYAQRDNRLENIKLTGFISDNGGTGDPETEPTIQHPAYAAIDLTKSKNFAIDTRVLTLRTDNPRWLLLRIYVNSNKPPEYNQNFEFNISITPPKGNIWLFIEIYTNKERAENAQIIGSPLEIILFMSNEFPLGSGIYVDKVGTLTLKYINNYLIIKKLSPFFTVYI